MGNLQHFTVFHTFAMLHIMLHAALLNSCTLVTGAQWHDCAVGLLAQPCHTGTDQAECQ